MTISGDTICNVIQAFPILLIIAQGQNRCLKTKFIYKPPTPTHSPEFYEAYNCLLQSLYPSHGSHGHDGHGSHGHDGHGSHGHGSHGYDGHGSHGYDGHGSHGYDGHGSHGYDGHGSHDLGSHGCHEYGHGYTYGMSYKKFPEYDHNPCNYHNTYPNIHQSYPGPLVYSGYPNYLYKSNDNVTYSLRGYAPGNQVYNTNNHKYKVVVKKIKLGKRHRHGHRHPQKLVQGFLNRREDQYARYQNNEPGFLNFIPDAARRITANNEPERSYDPYSNHFVFPDNRREPQSFRSQEYYQYDRYGRIVDQYGNVVITNRPGNNFGQPGNNFGQPGNNFGELGNNFGQPDSNFGQPGNNFGHQSNNFGQPSNNFGQSGNKFRQPGNNFGQAGNNFEQPGNNFGQPGNFGQPSKEFGQPGNNFWRPQENQQAVNFNNGETSTTTQKYDPNEDHYIFGSDEGNVNMPSKSPSPIFEGTVSPVKDNDKYIYGGSDSQNINGKDERKEEKSSSTEIPVDDDKYIFGGTDELEKEGKEGAVVMPNEEQPVIAPVPNVDQSSESPGFEPVPTRLPQLTPVPTRLPQLTPVPTRLPELTPVPTRLPELTPVPTGLPELTPVPTLLKTDSRFNGFQETCDTEDGGVGSCVLVNRCPELAALLRQVQVNPQAVQRLRRAHCGFQGNSPKVCCPKARFPTQAPFTTTTVAEPPVAPVDPVAPVGQDESVFPLPPVCGSVNSTVPRVVGGIPAKLGQFPWMANLGYQNRDSEVPRWLCGGSLVSARHVLTAAHCIHKHETDLYMVRLGELDLSRDDEGATPTDIMIKEKYKHEDYNAKAFTDDIGILLLVRAVEYTALIRPICMPLSESLRANNFVRYNPFIAGWGDTSFRGPSATHLQLAQIPVVTMDACKNAYRNYTKQVIDDRVLCAGYTKGGIDACQGDSGGPLMQPIMPPENARKFFFYQIGVVSFGRKCAEKGFPGVYSRVTHFVPWIEKTVRATMNL